MDMRNFESKLPPIRYYIDFKYIPDWLYNKPKSFLNFLFAGRQGFADLFNAMYQQWNESAAEEDRKTFNASQFAISLHKVADGKMIFRVVPPDEHEGSLVWCKEYIFAYDIDFKSDTSKVAYFTVEESATGIYLCRVGLNQERHNYGRIQENTNVVDTVCAIVFPDIIN